MWASSSGSVSQWIADLKEGDAAAVRAIWRRYFSKLADEARRKLGDFPRCVMDEEDIALSVLDTFYRGVDAGRFPDVLDRDDLWSLLLVITRQKTIDTKRWQSRAKRGGGHAPHGAAHEDTQEGQPFTLDELVGEDPTPEFVVAVQEEHQHLLGLLRDDTLRKIASRKLEGYSNDEIARQLEVSSRTVQRKLRLIQTSWEQELE